MKENIKLTVTKWSLKSGKTFDEEECEMPEKSDGNLVFIENSDSISMQVDGKATYVLDKDVCIAILEKLGRKATATMYKDGLITNTEMLKRERKRWL